MTLHAEEGGCSGLRRFVVGDTLRRLAKHLKTLKTVAELDRHLDAEPRPGIWEDDERFGVYCDEYARRGVPMPQ